ncbi:RNA polymerase sigma factor SigJ [Polymorphospora rubra]|uniref:RNA polymerase sigma factor n=1 Tax=Polymorphospora rubra TaxID=338584 RepID=A0A810NED3_9ACTN|nr:RNA polymerase sigma factor SigJ [Polymorphospora rubra]BCJ69645.1 RNA polymerase sigma factor [Polymorphospora rubra]
MDGWQEHRRYLFAVAYRLLGSVSDAEDAVQEAYLRLRRAAPADLVNPRAWLTTVTSRICLDMLGSARARREAYVGTWLPEPLAGYDDTDLGDTVALRESVRTAVLLVLETLSPAERVAFVLHDAFGMDFERLAVVVDRSPAACRQLASRARRRVREEAPPRKPVSAQEHQRVVAAFTAASTDGDLSELVHLLDPRVVLRSDGGGAVPAARKPVYGHERVLTLLSWLARRYAGVGLKPVPLAGGPGFVLELDGAVCGVIGVEVADGRIAELNLVVNPAKLRLWVSSPDVGNG